MANRRKRPVQIELDAQAIGARIRRLRLARGWYQRDLAKASGVHLAVIGAIERGLRVPSRDAAIALAVALRRSLNYLYFGLCANSRIENLAGSSGSRAGGLDGTKKTGSAVTRPATVAGGAYSLPTGRRRVSFPRRRSAATNRDVSNE